VVWPATWLFALFWKDVSALAATVMGFAELPITPPGQEFFKHGFFLPNLNFKYRFWIHKAFLGGGT
jgi:hypothetical protein